MTAPSRRRYAPRLPVAARREQLLDAALFLAAHHGAGAVTMERVARQAGVTKPVVYELFAERADLYGALLDREEQRALERLRRVVPPNLAGARSAHDVVAPAVQALLDAVRAEPDAWRILLMSADALPDSARDRYRSRRAELLTAVGALLSGARERGHQFRFADLELLAHSVVVLGELAGRLVMDSDELTFARITDHFTTLIADVLERSP
ncbi:MAG: TetR/AcrR family transcriptional regulator [Actinomycetota bacterium]|nr:TetR/AcrR family transcriptional regulator [Actinomycetota bacterium]